MTKDLLKNSYYIVVVVALILLAPFALPKIYGFLRSMNVPSDFDIYISIIFYILVGVISVECIRKMISNSLRRVLDEYSIRGMVSFFRIVSYAVLLIVITSAQQGSVVFGATLGGFMGLLLGMASKESLGNAISGIFLIITKPFRIGESINVAGGEGGGCRYKNDVHCRGFWGTEGANTKFQNYGECDKNKEEKGLICLHHAPFL